MNPVRSARLASGVLLAGLLSGLGAVAGAGEVSIEDARLRAQGDGRWHADVTLRHADSGWEHYADAWRVVGADGEVYGTRTLLHPHEHEQPFTRSLSGVAIPAGVSTVWVEAHDKQHGWSEQRLQVELPAGN